MHLTIETTWYIMAPFSGQPTKTPLSIQFQQTNHHAEKHAMGKCVQQPSVGTTSLLPGGGRLEDQRWGMSEKWDQGKAVRNNRNHGLLPLPPQTRRRFLTHPLNVHVRSIFSTSGTMLGPERHSRDQNPHGFYPSGAYSLIGKTNAEGSERRTA